MKSFTSQFAHPDGFIGSLAGWLMALKNRERNLWTINLLDLQEADHVLEIGFGPGWAIDQVARRVTGGCVAGVDLSATMLNNASRYNARSIQGGRVSLKLGSESPLPFGNGSFDKVFAVNSFQFWSLPTAGLNEVKRVLKPGGPVAITVQPMWVKTDEEAMQIGKKLQAQLAKSDFKRVRLETLRLKPLCLCAIGIK